MSMERGAKIARFNIDSRGNIFNISRRNYAGIFSVAYYARTESAGHARKITAELSRAGCEISNINQITGCRLSRYSVSWLRASLYSCTLMYKVNCTDNVP
jgi:hypothetical protein